MKWFLKCVTAWIALTFAFGCASSGTMLKSETVGAIPDGKYETIIRLDTPEWCFYLFLSAVLFIL